MNSVDKVKVQCRYGGYDNGSSKLCESFICSNFDNDNYVICSGYSYVDWVFYLINSKHLVRE